MPVLVGIGDSLMAGHNVNTSIREGGTDSGPSLPKLIGQAKGWGWLNQGIGSNTTSQIEARFAADVTAKMPAFCLANGGKNDLAAGGSEATYLTKWESILDQAEAADFRIGVLALEPWTAGTNTQMADWEVWNADLQSLVATYPNAVWLDARAVMGQFRAGGPAGNYWDINSAYDDDGVHPNSTGYSVWAAWIADRISLMPGGPLFPYSARPITAPRVFPYWYAGTSADMETMGFEASLGADAIWRAWYKMPPSLPSGTMKMALAAISAGAGNMRINVKWKSFGSAETLTSPSLNAEGVVTITTVANQLIESKVTMDADTPVAGEYVIVDITGETSSWTLASISGLLAPIIWE